MMKILINLSKTRHLECPPARYFVAARTTGMRNSVRIKSGWKLLTDDDGLPEAVTAGGNERLSAQAHWISRISDTTGNAIGLFRFSMNSTAGKNMTLGRNDEPLLSTGLDTIPANDSVRQFSSFPEFVQNRDTGLKYAVIKNDSNQFTVFTLFSSLKPEDSLTYSIKDSVSNHILFEGDLAVTNNPGLEDIISTTGLLLRIPSDSDDLNPVDVTTFSPFDDSLSAQFRFAAMTHQTLAHNSPRGNLNEEEAGIFSNYIRYFDDLVRNWSVVNDSAVGLPRLGAVYERILTLNRGKIVDSVWALNHGTLSEYGREVRDRKNYAFYEGYTRLMVDMERPQYGETEHTGAGIMFRVSDNIELYEANLADTFNMFGEPFLTGCDTTRRIMVTAGDSLLSKLDTDGLWVKGRDVSRGEESYYTGVQAVRLPMKAKGTVPVDQPFGAVTERRGKGDPEGKLVGGPERSVFRMYAMVKKINGTEDTLKNCENTHLLPAKQKRLFIFDSSTSNHFDNIQFRIIGDTALLNQIVFHNLAPNEMIINVKASIPKADSIQIMVLDFHNSSVVSRCFFKTVYVGSLAFNHEYISDVFRLTDGIYSVPLVKNYDKFIPSLFSSSGKVNLKVNGNMRVFCSRDTNNLSNQLLPDINGVFGNENGRDDDLWVDWNVFHSKVTNRLDTLYFIAPKDEGQFIIGYHDSGDDSKSTAVPAAGVEERVALGTPRILWSEPSDISGYYGYDIQHGSDSYLNILAGNTNFSKVQLWITQVEPEFISEVTLSSSNEDAFAIASHTRSDLDNAVAITIVLESTNTVIPYSLEWLNVSIKSLSGDEVKSRIGVVTYTQKTHAPISTFFCEDSGSPKTKISNTDILRKGKEALLVGVNNVFKKAIMNLEDVNELSLVDFRFDFNNNGILDLNACDACPQLEMNALIRKLMELKGDSENDVVGFVEKLNANYLLKQDALKGTNTVVIYYSDAIVNKIVKGSEFGIGGNISSRERIYVKDDPIVSIVDERLIATLNLREPLKFNHSTNETVWRSKLGVALSNMAIVVPSKGTAVRTFAHELLHLPTFGSLRDVNDKKNVMLWTTDGSTGDNLLRFRGVPTVRPGTVKGELDGGFNNQWDMIHGYSR